MINRKTKKKKKKGFISLDILLLGTVARVMALDTTIDNIFTCHV